MTMVITVTMTNVSALLSFGMIPLWLLVVPKVITDVEIIVPFKDIAIGVAQVPGYFSTARAFVATELMKK